MNTKKIIICAIVVVMATGLIICGMLSMHQSKGKEFETYAFSSTCTVEIPKWIKFNDNNYSSSASSGGVNMQDYSKTLSSTNDELYTIMYVKATFNGETLGIDDAGAVTTNLGNKEHYSRHVTNGETGESVWIQGTNKTLVDYVADHVKFNGKNATNNTTSTGQQSDNNKQQSDNKKTNTTYTSPYGKTYPSYEDYLKEFEADNKIAQYEEEQARLHPDAPQYRNYESTPGASSTPSRSGGDISY